MDIGSGYLGCGVSMHGALHGITGPQVHVRSPNGGVGAVHVRLSRRGTEGIRCRGAAAGHRVRAKGDGAIGMLKLGIGDGFDWCRGSA